MLQDGLRTIEDVRFRFDGERRNPSDEPECGHHYARAMSSWSTLVALTGFHYHGADRLLSLRPNAEQHSMTALWSTGAAWGSFSIGSSGTQNRTGISVLEGSLPVQTIRLRSGRAPKSSIQLDAEMLDHSVNREGASITLHLQGPFDADERQAIDRFYLTRLVFSTRRL